MIDRNNVPMNNLCEPFSLKTGRPSFYWDRFKLFCSSHTVPYNHYFQPWVVLFLFYQSSIIYLTLYSQVLSHGLWDIRVRQVWSVNHICIINSHQYPWNGMTEYINLPRIIFYITDNIYKDIWRSIMHLNSHLLREVYDAGVPCKIEPAMRNCPGTAKSRHKLRFRRVVCCATTYPL